MAKKRNPTYEVTKVERNKLYRMVRDRLNGF